MDKVNKDWVFFVTSVSVPVERNGRVIAEIQFNPNNEKALQISREGVNYLLEYLNKLGEGK